MDAYDQLSIAKKTYPNVDKKTTQIQLLDQHYKLIHH
jgi:hypothetical protein